MIKLTLIGGTINLETPPTAFNVELDPDFPVMIFQLLNKKTEKDMNGNMDQSQVMRKSFFRLIKTLKYHNESISA